VNVSIVSLGNEMSYEDEENETEKCAGDRQSGGASARATLHNLHFP
jgi:hypothetical protein